MNDQDKADARLALEQKRLSIEQVQEIRTEVDRTGRSFKDVAASRGLPAAPKPRPPAPKAVPLPAPAPRPAPALQSGSGGRRLPPLYLGLLAASFLIFAGLLIGTMLKLRERSSKDDDLAMETERSRLEADRRAVEASRGYKKSVISVKEGAAREQLEKARAAMVKAETLTRSGASPTELGLALNDAFVGYNMYLKELPDDAPVLVERARTHEMRRNYDLAVADLERAAQLQPEQAPALKERVAQLRLFIARQPK